MSVCSARSSLAFTTSIYRSRGPSFCACPAHVQNDLARFVAPRISVSVFILVVRALVTPERWCAFDWPHLCAHVTLVLQVHSIYRLAHFTCKSCTMRQQPSSPLRRLASCLVAVLLLLVCSVKSGTARITRTLQDSGPGAAPQDSDSIPVWFTPSGAPLSVSEPVSAMGGTGCGPGSGCDASNSPAPKCCRGANQLDSQPAETMQ